MYGMPCEDFYITKGANQETPAETKREGKAKWQAQKGNCKEKLTS